VRFINYLTDTLFNWLAEVDEATLVVLGFACLYVVILAGLIIMAHLMG